MGRRVALMLGTYAKRAIANPISPLFTVEPIATPILFSIPTDILHCPSVDSWNLFSHRKRNTTFPSSCNLFTMAEPIRDEDKRRRTKLAEEFLDPGMLNAKI
jgi:hypothetical protein